MGVKVSVIIPVHNDTGRLDTCLRSALDQSLDEYEVIAVDDGSVDGTSEKLGALAAIEPRLRVLHAGGTGGPGGPRNLGVDAAAGEYVFFLDHDDRLAPRALERMTATASRTGADIVIGRVVGHGRGVPRSMFRANRDRADILDDHLLGFLTPHKLFRTAFLRRHGLRFAEGPAWLEDHRFVVKAYFRATVISVVADEVCYHWHRLEPRRNHSARRFDPRAYYQALREVLDIVDAHTVPGDARNQMYASWYHAKMLRLVRGPSFLGLPLLYRRYAHYREIRRLARERFPDDVDRFLPLSMRVRAHLLRAGAYGDLARLAAAERGLTLVPTLRSLRWQHGTLAVEADAQLVYADGTPVRFRRSGDRLLWIPPVRPRTRLPDDVLEATDLVAASRLEVYVRNRADAGEYLLPSRDGTVRLDGEEVVTVTVRGLARLDVGTARLGQPLDVGVWDLVVRLDSCGWGPARRLPRPQDNTDRAPAARRVVPSSGVAVAPYWTTVGTVAVRVRPATSSDYRRCARLPTA